MLQELLILAYRCDKKTAREHHFGQWTLDAGGGTRRGVQNPENALAVKRFRAIDLSCRACGAGAGCWAWIPGRGTFGVHPQPPIISIGNIKMLNEVHQKCEYWQGHATKMKSTNPAKKGGTQKC